MGRVAKVIDRSNLPDLPPVPNCFLGRAWPILGDDDPHWPKSHARSLRYLLRPLTPDANGPTKWIVWAPGLPPDLRTGVGTRPMNALLAAHRTVRNALRDRSPDYRAELTRRNDSAIKALDHEALCTSRVRRARAQWEQRREEGHDDGPAPQLGGFEAITGVPRRDPRDMETLAFAAIGANLLNKKWIHNLLTDPRFPTRWAWFIARASTTKDTRADDGATRQRKPRPLPSYVRTGLIDNPSLPPRLARYLFANGMGDGLHQNLATPTDVIETMAANGVVGTLEHPALPVHVLREAFANLEPGNIDHKRAFKAIARHPKCPRDLVQLMAGNPDRFVRRVVAWRADLDPFVRAVLARDECPGVRKALEASRWETWCRCWTDA